jgi:ABC-2 type transport system permease protein
MSAIAATSRRDTIREEVRKLPAFFRRDLLVSWSYKLAFFSDWLNLIAQVLVFYFVSDLVNPAKVPSFGGQQASYMQFVVVGIAVTSFVQVSLARVTTAIRTEQLQGTLETLLLTPTAPATFQLGSALYELVYVPVRVVLFLAISAVLFGVSFTTQGLPEAIAVLVVFVPVVWGLGIASAAATITFRRGTTLVGAIGSVLTISSGAYFPVDSLPSWASWVATLNPVRLALDAVRDALLGGAGWADVAPTIAILVPMAVVSLVVGVWSFRAALRRERKNGTLGLY